MNNSDKEYIDRKFEDAEQARKTEGALVHEKLNQRKARLLKIFSVYAAIMLIAIAVVVYYLLNNLSE